MSGIVEFVFGRARSPRENAPPAINAKLARRAVETVLRASLGIPKGDLADSSRRGRRLDLLRQIAMYLVHVGAGVDMRAVGEAFRRDRTTVAHACRLVEDWRDDKGFDRLLDCLERATVALAEALALGRSDTGRLP